MSKRKRAADAEPAIGAAGPDPRPVSAFAAARARQHQVHNQPSDHPPAPQRPPTETAAASNGATVAPGDGSAPSLLGIAEDAEDVQMDSAGEDGGLDEEDDDGVEPRPVWQLSNWKPARDRSNVLSYSPKSAALVLKKSQTLAYVGSYTLRVIKGIVHVYGARLRTGESVQIHAPASHPIPIIQGVSEETEVEISSLSSSPAALRHLSPSFGRIWDVKEKGERYKVPEIETASFVIDTSSDKLHRPLNPLLFTPEWKDCLNKVSASGKPQIVLVDGPTNSGKSTYLKVIMNSFPRHSDFKQNPPPPSVHLLDLDPSQPEFTSPGQISLVRVSQPVFGPSICYPSQESRPEVEVRRALPAVVKNPLDFLDYFLDAVSELLDCYHNEDLPRSSNLLVVNPPAWGYQTASGLNFLAKVISALKHSTDRLNAEFRQLPCPQYYANILRSDKELQSMHLQSLFHKSGESAEVARWKAQPLSFQPPVVVHYGESAEQGFIGVLKVGNWVSPDYAHEVLNGSIVSVISTSDPRYVGQYGKVPGVGPHSIPYLSAVGSDITGLPNPATSQVQFLALVAAVDGRNQTLRLVVPPSSRHKLNGLDPKKTVLVVGGFETPEWCYVEDPYYDTHQARKEELKRKGLSGEDDEDDIDMEAVFGADKGSGEKLPRWVTTKKEMEKFGDLHLLRKVH